MGPETTMSETTLSGSALSTPLDIKSLTLPKLTTALKERGHKKYRAEQVFRWIHHTGASSFEEMTNVPKELRENPQLSLGGLELVKVLESVDGTKKLLLRTANGQMLETVVIPMGKGRLTQCVSSQIGCKMACDFCATAEMPRRQNLLTSEIVDQVYHARRLLEPLGHKVTNLVFMGMGEPLDNFDNVVDALWILLDQKGAAFGQRRITVSTVGLAPRIGKFGEAVPVNLAVSLNATTNEQRDALMPINKAFPIEALVQALKDYPLAPRRRIYIEYVMLGGVNDTPEDAHRLPGLLKDLRVKINLIPFNPYPGSRFTSPTNEMVLYFRDYLMRNGIQTNIREPKGRDIQAACGMLDGDKPL
ncbi:MAG: 23S rRNA (adenine2503-C2)-methyltransferase [Myxococcota bacterium]|jgi:23S rRNA (adenine2503-C2)-methyltransferase